MSHRLHGRWSWGQKKAALLMYPSYMAAIAGRVAMDAALPAMLLDRQLACSPTDTARLLSTGVMFYSLGKVVGGGIIDRIGGAVTFMATMMTAGTMQGMCSMSNNVGQMSLLWGVWRLAAACFWPAMNKVVASWWDEHEFGQAWSILTTSSKLGAIAGGIMAASILRVASWRALLRVASMLLAASGGMMILFLRDGPGAVDNGTPLASTSTIRDPAARRDKNGFQLPVTPVGEGGTGDSHNSRNTATSVGDVKLSYPRVLWRLMTSNRVLLTLATQAFVLPLNELTSLLPLYIMETAAVDMSTASSMAISYPVGAIVSMVLSGRLFDRLTDRGRLHLFVVQHALAVVCLQVLSTAPSGRVLMMACMTGTMMGVAPTIFLAPSALVTRYASLRYNGTLVGLIDAPGYVASMIFLKQYPRILGRGGWSMLMRMAQIAVLCGSVCNSAVWWLEIRERTTKFVV